MGLELKNVTKKFKTIEGERVIFENLNVHFPDYGFIAITGESGSGKSTLFELITKNLKPIQGKITSQKISSIYQDPYSSFHPFYSIIEQIKDVTDDLSELGFLLEKFSLDSSHLEKKPHQLSGGQLQRCSIVRALLMKPDLLLADEPTSALDNIIALDVMKILISLGERFGILLITHDEDLAKWCSDEIINIENNQIYKRG